MLTFSLLEVFGLLLSAAASVVLGGLWYSPLVFGTLWMREIGLTEAKMKNMSTTPAQAIGIAIVLGVLFALLMNLLFTWVGVHTVAQGTLLSGVCCVTFFIVPLLVHSVFEDGSKKVWALYAAHELILSLIVGAIVAWSILA